MAREFNGTNQSLVSAANVDLSALNIITLAFFLYVPSFADDFDMCLELTADGLANTGGFIFSPNWTVGVCEVGWRASSINAADFPRPSAAAWHQYIIEMDLTVSGGTIGQKVWVDNVSQTMSAVLTNGGSGTFANSTLYVMTRANSSLFLAGRLAELAIYSGTLTSGQRASLQTDAPAIVGSPVFYWPICGTSSPEPFSSPGGSVSLTVNGATFVTDPLVLNGSTCVVSTARRSRLAFMGVS